VATFHDANPNAKPADFSATIDWGDSSSAASVVSLGSGNFAVLGTHAYAEEGPSTLSVQVADDDQALTATAAVTVSDAPLSQLQVQPPTPTEGTSTGAVTLATFHDANPDASAADFSVTIDWGDGSSTASVVSQGGGNFAVVGAHTYAEEGPYTLAVQVGDDGGQSLTASAPASISDAPLSQLQVLPPSASEGTSTGSVTLATFHDANPNAKPADFSATIDWGDGTSTASVVSLGSGNFAVLGTHAYAEEGPSTLSVQVGDDGGQSSTASAAVSVSDAQLTDLQLTAPSTKEGASTGPVTLATFHDANPNADATDFSVTIDWGDGSSTPGVVTLDNGRFDVVGSHTYTRGGDYTLSVQVRDDGSQTLTATAAVTVRSVATTATSTAIAPPPAPASTDTVVLLENTNTSLVPPINLLASSGGDAGTLSSPTTVTDLLFSGATAFSLTTDVAPVAGTILASQEVGGSGAASATGPEGLNLQADLGGSLSLVNAASANLRTAALVSGSTSGRWAGSGSEETEQQSPIEKTALRIGNSFTDADENVAVIELLVGPEVQVAAMDKKTTPARPASVGAREEQTADQEVVAVSGDVPVQGTRWLAPVAAGVAVVGVVAASWLWGGKAIFKPLLSCCGGVRRLAVGLSNLITKGAKGA
jgi:hypothetical protein